MKKVLLMLFTAVLLVCSYGGGQAFATSSKTTIDQAKLDQYLKEIGWTEKGWTEQDFDDYLSEWWGASLDDYRSVDELRDDLDLGHAINDESLKALFADYESYGITQADITKELAKMDYKLEDFKFINDLKESLGPATADKEALQELLAEYQNEKLTEDKLDEILAKDGETRDDYPFIYDLYDPLDAYFYPDDQSFGDEIDADFIKDILSVFGIDGDEFDRLKAHLKALDQDAIEEKFLEIEEQAEALPEFETANDLTDAEREQMAGLYEKMLDAFELKARYYLVKDKKETEITLQQLLRIDDNNGADLKIVLYNLDGTQLVDLILTGDQFGSDMMTQTEQKVMQKVKPLASIHTAASVHTPNRAVNKGHVMHTVKGGKMPKTAGNYLGHAMGGVLMVSAGLGLFIYNRRKNSKRLES